MKTNLLLLLPLILLWLPATHAQLLTAVPNSTESTEAFEVGSYVAIGFTGRAVLGYRQMRNLYDEQGFSSLPLQEFLTLGYGLDLGGRFYLNFSWDRSFLTNDPEDIEYANGTTLSFKERKDAVNATLGYRFWQKQHRSLLVHAGLSGVFNRVEIVERLSSTFDFNNVNAVNPRGVRSWPLFIHRQAALHLALQLKLSYPRQRWWSSDLDIKLGFVSGLKAKPWLVKPGETLNLISDNAQYLYISGTYHFFSRNR